MCEFSYDRSVLGFMLRRIVRIVSLVFGAVRDTLVMFVIYLPGETGIVLRQMYYRRRLKSMGRNVRIEPGVFFQHPECISIGENCWIDRGVMLLAGKPIAGEDRRLIRGKNRDFEGEIVLGDKIHVAAYCTVAGMGGLRIGNNTGIGTKTSIYTYTSVSLQPSILYSNGLVIGENVSIGSNCVLVGLSKIRTGEIVKPNTFMSGTFFERVN